MADKKLRIPRKLKTETLKQLKIRTDMNSDAPYESVVRTSLIPLQGRKSWGQLPSLLLKIEGGGNSFAPLFGNKFKKKKLFLLKYGSIYCPFSKGYKDIWTRVCFETIVTFCFFFYCCTVLKIYQTNKEYIFCTNFIKMYTECNEHHLN